MTVSQLVANEVRRRFPPESVDFVLDKFRSTRLGYVEQPGFEGDRDRIQFAILKQAAGDPRHIEPLLALAVTDWRDLLIATGLADEDWPEVLRAAGFPV